VAPCIEVDGRLHAIGTETRAADDWNGKKKSVYDKKRERRRSEQIEGAAASDDFDGVDSGVLLTESVEEALEELHPRHESVQRIGVQVDAAHRGAVKGVVINDELWELTWAVVDPVLPHPQAESLP